MDDKKDEPVKIIPPTVGRKVWYTPSDDDRRGSVTEKAMEVNGEEPLDATVVAVWGERLVNLAILDIYGNLHARRSVTLLQAGDPVPERGRYARWMPYQLGQAKAAS